MATIRELVPFKPGDPPITLSEEFLSEQLIAELLEEELRSLLSAQEAERIIYDEAIQDSFFLDNAEVDSSSSLALVLRDSPPPMLDSDAQIALQLTAQEFHLQSDHRLAEELQAIASTAIADQQYALKIAAAERKATIDYEFAKRLQGSDRYGVSDDAESVLGKRVLEDMLRSDHGDWESNKLKNTGTMVIHAGGRGKGKARDISEDLKDLDRSENQLTILKFRLTCGICLDEMKLVHSPITVSSTAGVSSALPLGFNLGCDQDHKYCLSCINRYIFSRIDPDGKGQASPEKVVFPIPCPECPLEIWPDGLTDKAAIRVLSEKGMELWRQQKYFDSVRRIWCPYKDCSAMIEVPNDEDPILLECRACTRVMCLPCGVRWHKDLSCDQYQALPLEERSPEDRVLLDLARANKWRRCPHCKVIVELVSGCNHMVCTLCGTHFCFKCGALANRKTGLCTRQNPTCDLWDEEMLYAEEERRRQQALPVPRAVGVEDFVDALVAAVEPENEQPPVQLDHLRRTRRGFNLAWMENLGQTGRSQLFTRDMVINLRCGYCHSHLNSLAALQYHLGHVRKHPVFACCNRFYPNAQSLQQHRRNEAVLEHTEYYNNQ